MINLSEPLDRLRAVNPVPSIDALPGADPVLFRHITDGGRVAVPRTRRARRLVPVFVVAGVVGGAAAYGLLRGEVTKPERVACYEQADLRAATGVVSVDERGPVAACADLWQRGVFGAGVPVPALTQCVLDSGVVGVFPTTPGQDVCALLNLPPAASTAPPPRPTPGEPAPAPAPADVNARVLAMRDAVTSQFVESPCVEPEAGAAIVRRELDRAGLSDWTIRGGGGQAGDGFSAQRPCATLSIRAEIKEVVLVPAPRR